ncbi:MAG: hypothetical protein JSU07_03140 [Bacteroidetes bacterium]|nr:hypothetical protein [Bacteroidota bacterium]
MKKIFFLASVFATIQGNAVNTSDVLAAPTWTIVVKSSGGFFGYKYVNQDNNNPSGNSSLNCSEPGFRRCKWNATAFVAGENPFTNDDFEKIDELVMMRVNETNSSGTIVYNSYTIKYDYNIAINKLSYKVFSQEEVNRGLINE